MPKTAYTQEDYIRALLRSAISTSNNRLETILNKHLGGTIVLRDDGGNSIYIDDRNVNNHAFDMSYSCLNKKFFYSPQNDDGANLIAQAFGILSRGKKIREQLADHRKHGGPEVKINPELLKIVDDYNIKFEEGVREYIREFRKNSGLTYSESEIDIKAEKAQPKLKGSDYEDRLIERGFEGRKLQQAKYFLDVLGKQYSQTRIIDFVDVYTLYHYYIFRNSINERFMEFVNSNPNVSMRTKQITFEKIVKEEIQKHCNSQPSISNVFFDRKYMSLAPRRIDSTRAKGLSLDVMEGTSGAKKLLKAQLQTMVNVSMPEGARVEIEELEFRPKTKSDFKYMLDDKARRKALESARLLTTVNCGLFVDDEYYPIVNNDFYSGSSGTISTTLAKPVTQNVPKTETKEMDAVREQQEEARRFSDYKQLSLF